MIRADYADSFPIRLAWDLTGESGIDEGTLTEVTMLLARVTPLIRLRGVKRLQLATEYNGALHRFWSCSQCSQIELCRRTWAERSTHHTVNCLGVKPRGFPWINRTLPRDHRLDSLERSSGSRSAGSHSPMPAVAVSEQSVTC